MNKLLLDTNFLLDVAIEGRPESDSAATLFEAAAAGKISCLVAASSLKDFYYIGRREISDELRWGWVELFYEAFEVANMGSEEVAAALHGEEPDFEDGLILAIAELSRCCCIISRDERAFIGSPIPRLSPREYLKTRLLD